MSYSFPKSEKLCSKKRIEKLFRQGNSVQSFPLKMIFVRVDDLPEQIPFQVMVSVPKRHFKRAVHRNRIKRLLRESYRLQKSFLLENTAKKYALAILYTDKEIPDFNLIYDKLRSCLNKFIEKVNHSE